MSWQQQKMQYLMGQQDQERADAGLNMQGLFQSQNLGEGARQFNENLGMGYDQMIMQAIDQFIGAQGQDFQQQLASFGANEDSFNNAFGRDQQQIANALSLFLPPQYIDTYAPAQMSQNRAANQAGLDQQARSNRFNGIGSAIGMGLSMFNPVAGVFGQGIGKGIDRIFGG